MLCPLSAACWPADTITASNEAYAAKEKALAEVSALKLTAEKEHASFEDEWRQLTQLIEEDRCGACLHHYSWLWHLCVAHSWLSRIMQWQLHRLHRVSFW